MRISAFILALYAFGTLSAADSITHPKVRSELLRMESEDQRFRLPGNLDLTKAEVINKKHVARLKDIVGEYGWPTIPMVGIDGEQAAWLIVQHADTNREFQVSVLSLITPLVATREVTAQTYAYLYDRIHRPQLYGTQGECKRIGQWEPYAIEEPSGIDDRRKKMGMEPMATYIRQVSTYICTQEHMRVME